MEYTHMRLDGGTHHHEGSSEKDKTQHIVHHMLVRHVSSPEHPLHGIPAAVTSSVRATRDVMTERVRTSVSTPGLSPRTAADPSCTDAQCRGQEDRRGSGQSALSRSKATLECDRSARIQCFHRDTWCSSRSSCDCNHVGSRNAKHMVAQRGT